MPLNEDWHIEYAIAKWKGKIMRLIPVLLSVLLIPLFVVFMPLMAFAQDAVATDGFWSFLEAVLPAQVIIWLIVLRQVSEVIAKAIPDTSTGMLGGIRRIFKILAVYIPNRT